MKTVCIDKTRLSERLENENKNYNEDNFINALSHGKE